jgi:hypothetical protein
MLSREGEKKTQPYLTHTTLHSVQMHKHIPKGVTGKRWQGDAHPVAAGPPASFQGLHGQTPAEDATLMSTIKTKGSVSHQLKTPKLKQQSGSKNTIYISHELGYLNDRLVTKPILNCGILLIAC